MVKLQKRMMLRLMVMVQKKIISELLIELASISHANGQHLKSFNSHLCTCPDVAEVKEDGHLEAAAECTRTGIAKARVAWLMMMRLLQQVQPRPFETIDKRSVH